MIVKFAIDTPLEENDMMRLKSFDISQF